MNEKQEIRAESMHMSLKLAELIFKRMELRGEKPLDHIEAPKEVREDPDMWSSYFPITYSSLKENSEWFERFIKGEV